MKTFWFDATGAPKDLITAALESGAEAILLADGASAAVKRLGRIKTVAVDGDLKPGREVEFIELTSKADENRAAAVPADKILILSLSDWTVIPIENLLARRRGKILVRVETSEQAKLMTGILEKGVDGVVLKTSSPDEIKKTAGIILGLGEKIELVTAKVTATRQLGMGDRCCLDSCTQMKPGEGMLVGNTASGFFLVHSESLENPYVAARPFRVNAGAVHAYTLIPGGGTRYLADLKTGDELLLVDHTGRSQAAYLGRNKIEKRPMMLVEAEAGGHPVSLVLQNAETIRLVSPAGEAISITELAPGREVLAHLEGSGRHFGMRVEETLMER